MTSSTDYYDVNSQAFFDRTAPPMPVMDAVQARFLADVPVGGAILDAGCGAGRDSLAFSQAGYAVTAFDGSAEMAKLASAHTGLAVRHLRFEAMDWRDAFGGVWACASLLHLRPEALPDAFARIAAALRPGGVFYCSFRRGTEARWMDGRWFTDLDETALAGLLAGAGLEVAELWLTDDIRPEAAGRKWTNALATKASP